MRLDIRPCYNGYTPRLNYLQQSLSRLWQIVQENIIWFLRLLMHRRKIYEFRKWTWGCQLPKFLHSHSNGEKRQKKKRKRQTELLHLFLSIRIPISNHRLSLLPPSLSLYLLFVSFSTSKTFSLTAKCLEIPNFFYSIFLSLFIISW